MYEKVKTGTGNDTHAQGRSNSSSPQRLAADRPCTWSHARLGRGGRHLQLFWRRGHIHDGVVSHVRVCVCLCVCVCVRLLVLVCARNSAVVNSKLRKEQRWRSESYWNGVVQENELQCPSTLRNRAPDNSPIPTHVFWGAQRNGMGRSRGCKVQNPLLSCHATKGHHPERTLVSKFMRVRALCVFARIRSPQWLSPGRSCLCVFVFVFVSSCLRFCDVTVFKVCSEQAPPSILGKYI